MTSSSARKRASNGEPLRFIHEIALPHQGAECLLWPYGQYKRGYGQVSINGKNAQAHRYICKVANGAPPTPRHEAAHDCGNNLCVNPRHLKWKTPSQNQADRVVHGTHDRGERSTNAKLSEEQARAILRLKGVMPQQKIAAQFQVCKTTISLIHSRKRWSWIEDDQRARQQGLVAGAVLR